MTRRNHNNFDLLRLLAASQVLTTHTFSHLGLDLGFDMLGCFPGVPIFFVISGYLVSQSYERTSLPTYFANRALRIYPGLWACLAVSVLIAVLWGGVSFSGSGPWLAAQVTFVQFYNPEFLRSFGTGVLNGSLWTIPVELQFYLALPLLYWILRSHKALLAAIVVCAAINCCFAAWGLEERTFVQKLIGQTLPIYLYMFLVGVALQRNRWFVDRYLVGKLPVWLIAYICAAWLLQFTGLRTEGNFLNPISAVMLAFLTVSAAYARHIPIRHDLSYGLYLYHMPVVNAFIESNEHSYLAAAKIVAITFALAAASWMLVERPALGLKRFFANAPPRVPTVQSATSET